LAALAPGLRLHVIRRAIEETVGSTDGITTVHLLAVDTLVAAHRAGRCEQLPKGLYAEASGGTLVLARSRPSAPRYSR